MIYLINKEWFINCRNRGRDRTDLGMKRDWKFVYPMIEACTKVLPFKESKPITFMSQFGSVSRRSVSKSNRPSRSFLGCLKIKRSFTCSNYSYCVWSHLQISRFLDQLYKLYASLRAGVLHKFEWFDFKIFYFGKTLWSDTMIIWSQFNSVE